MGFISNSFSPAVFPFQTLLEIISKHASDACIFSFTYNLIVTSWHLSKISYKLSISPGQSVFSDHFPFAIKDCDHSLTHRLRPAALTPKEVRNSQLFPPRGLAENPIPSVLRLWLQTVTIGTGNTHQHPASPCPTSFASMPLAWLQCICECFEWS